MRCSFPVLLGTSLLWNRDLAKGLWRREVPPGHSGSRALQVVSQQPKSFTYNTKETPGPRSWDQVTLREPRAGCPQGATTPRERELGPSSGPPPAGLLRDAVVIVVGGCGIGQDGDEAVLGAVGAAGCWAVPTGQSPAVVVTVAAGVVEILVELIAVHLPQQLRLAQLVQGVEAMMVGWWGELTKVGMEVGRRQGGEGGCVVAGRRRRRRKGRTAGG